MSDGSKSLAELRLAEVTEAAKALLEALELAQRREVWSVADVQNRQRALAELLKQPLLAEPTIGGA